MSKEHSFADKVKVILIEILISVFAVTLSIWFHSWSENRHNENDEAHKEQDVGQPLGYTLHVMCAYRWKPSSSYNLFHVNTFRNFLETPDSLSDKEDFHFRGMK